MIQEKTNDEMVEEIHTAFYSAEERLLQEAKALLAGSSKDKEKYAERVKKLGFGKAKPVKEVADITSKTSQAAKTVSAIEYWRIHYPNNKFITEVEVKAICEKYGLLLGEAGNYLGDIPEKNLSEIEAFQLRNEDWVEKRNGVNEMADILRSYVNRSESLLGLGGMDTAQQYERYLRSIGPFSSIGIDPFARDTKKKTAPVSALVEKERSAFKICAPQKDFQTGGYEVREGYRLVYDPVVLQPVKDGYLIVTAWGKEASDEIVVNHNSN